jgi:hypothetical protein
MKKVAILALLIIIISSCQKEVSAVKEDVPASLSALFTKNRTEAQQSATVSGLLGGTIQGTKGAKFKIGPNSFVLKNGAPITGEVKLEILEVYTPVDMILSNLPTMSNGQPLESGGEFLVRASYNGQEAILAPGRTIAINLPGDNLDGMQVFNGQLNADSTVNWVLNTGPTGVWRDSLGSPGANAYTLFSDSVNWINCDKFLNEPRISCSFTPVDCPSADSTNIYVHFTGRNSVVNVFNFTTQQFQSDLLIAAPVTLVGICIWQGKLYASITPATLGNNITYNVIFTATTEDKLKEQLNKLQ